MKRKCFFWLLVLFLTAWPLAYAGTKEELVRLQSDVLTLQDQLREFDKTFNERIDGLKSLIVQLNDQVGKTGLTLDKINSALENQSSGTRSTDQTLIQEVRKLSEKIDETGTRISALAQQLNELKVQSKALNDASTGAGNLSPEALYNQAFSDFVQGNFDMAIQGFSAYLTTYPAGDKGADALLYTGEAYSSQNKLSQAVAAFTRVINDYPNSDKVSSSLFKRAKVEIALQEKENAIADLKNILEKYPSSPEADLAKAELNSLGALQPAKKTTNRKTR
jgi:tol-pal system protein YbgF